MVKKRNNYVFGGNLLPQSLGEGLQVINLDQCLHIVMAIGKCTDVFRGIFWLKGRGYMGGSFYGGICHGETEFP